MPLNRTFLFITLSSVALLLVLIIQVNWIFQTAKIKEELFNEKANLVLSRTTEAIGADKATSGKIMACVGQNDTPTSITRLGNQEVHKIDSLVNHYMKVYKLHIDYTFEVENPVATSTSVISKYLPSDQQGCYAQNLEETSGAKGLQLKLVLPEKKQFIIAEMGSLFITSIILILIVLVLFWRTVRSLLLEKRIAEHTTDFLNNMTHEFKTPLTNISLAGKMILKETALRQEDKIKHYSGIILEENEKLRLQVEQVLSMTALERGEIPLQKTELDLHQLITSCVKCMSMQLEQKEGNASLQLNAERFVVMGDETHLTNALCNLLDNAVKYAKEKPEIIIETSNSGNKVVMRVSDTGIGIEKQYLEKVFDKFFRVPTGNVHDVKGFGLGLAYVRKIIESHGGEITLESEKGKGCTFTITFPYA